MTDDLATNPQGGDDLRAVDAPGVAANAAYDDPDLELPGEALDDQDSPDGEEAEIEHDGQRYRVPRALRDAFLRHADYTRKTQELADQRRALERQAAEAAHAGRQNLEDYARLVATNDQVRAYEQIDWSLLEAQDPARAQRLWREYSQLKDGRAEIAQKIRWSEEQRALEEQRRAATLAEHCHDELSREIKDWSPQLADRLSDFGRQAFGFSDDELQSVVDPRMIRVLHLAWFGDQALRRQGTADRMAASQAARPAMRVGASAPAGRNPDRMSTDEWMAYERDRVRKRGR